MPVTSDDFDDDICSECGLPDHACRGLCDSCEEHLCAECGLCHNEECDVFDTLGAYCPVDPEELE